MMFLAATDLNTAGAGVAALLGYGTVFLGLIALMAAGYLMLRASMNRQMPVMDPGVQAIIQENKARAAELEAKAQAFTQRYTDAPVTQALARICETAARLENLSRREQEAQSARAALKSSWISVRKR